MKKCEEYVEEKKNVMNEVKSLPKGLKQTKKTNLRYDKSTNKRIMNSANSQNVEHKQQGRPTKKNDKWFMLQQSLTDI